MPIGNARGSFQPILGLHPGSGFGIGGQQLPELILPRLILARGQLLLEFTDLTFDIQKEKVERQPGQAGMMAFEIIDITGVKLLDDPRHVVFAPLSAVMNYGRIGQVHKAASVAFCPLGPVKILVEKIEIFVVASDLPEDAGARHAAGCADPFRPEPALEM